MRQPELGRRRPAAGRWWPVPGCELGRRGWFGLERGLGRSALVPGGWRWPVAGRWWPVPGCELGRRGWFGLERGLGRSALVPGGRRWPVAGRWWPVPGCELRRRGWFGLERGLGGSALVPGGWRWPAAGRWWPVPGCELRRRGWFRARVEARSSRRWTSGRLATAASTADMASWASGCWLAWVIAAMGSPTSATATSTEMGSRPIRDLTWAAKSQARTAW